MTLFLLGFLSAVALISITLILYALRGYHRQERQRQAHVDAIMAKIMADPVTRDAIAARAELQAMWDKHGELKWNERVPDEDLIQAEAARQRIAKLGKKGIH